MHLLPGLLRSARRRLQPAGEDGFGIIEVLVSALIVVLVTLGVLAAVDAAGRTADTNKARSAASNLATADQERLRSIPISDLTNLDYTPPAATVVDNKSYTVRSQGAYVVGTGVSAQCASSEAAPKYLKITSTVTWPNMKAKPVKQESLRAMPNGTVAGRGSLAVDIDGRDGVGLTDPVSVTITGPQTVTGTTNANGCVIFGFIPAGTYTVAFGKQGYMESKSPYRQDVSDSVVVAVDATAAANYQYDQASSVAVTYQTTASAGSGTVGTATAPFATDPKGFTIANAGLGTPNYKIFSTSPGTSIFPFTPYEVWAGPCAGAKPPTAADVVTATMTPGQQTAVNVREPKLRFRARRKSSTNVDQNIPNGTNVRLRPTSTGCSGLYTATVSGGYVTFDVPYGTYTLCMQYANSSNRGTRTTAGFVSNVPQGKDFGTTAVSPNPAVPVVPYSTNTSFPLCPST